MSSHEDMTVLDDRLQDIIKNSDKDLETLPAWLRTELPPVRPVKPITYDPSDGTYRVDGRSFPDIIAADSYAKDLNVAYAVDLPEYDHDDLNSSSTIFITRHDKDYGRLLVSLTDQESVHMLAYTLREFLTIAEDYRADPNDFKNAYKYVTLHPAFWTRINGDKTFYWIDDQPGFDVNPYFNDDGKRGWEVEGGGHVFDDPNLPSYTAHYDDVRLSSYAGTIEEAYVRFAARVDLFFNDDGTEKENVKYEKSALELELDKIVADHTS
jgi:hypothetical protein